MRNTTKRILRRTGLAVLAAVAGPAVAATVPLVANFDFETVDSAAAWKEMSSRDKPSSSLKLDTTNPHSGNSALKFQTTAAGGESRFVFTGVSLPENHPGRIRVRFYARGENLSPDDAEINALGRDRTQVLGWCGGEQAMVKIKPTPDWQEYTAEVPVDPRARLITFMLRINNPAAGKALWVDDLSIEFVDSPRS